MGDSIRIIANIGAVKVDLTNNINETTDFGVETPVPAGMLGSLTTGATTGVITLAAPPNVDLSNVLGIFWNGGYRLGMTITNVSNVAPYSITVTAASGAGSPLPTGPVSVVASAPMPLDNTVFNASAMLAFGMSCDQQVAVQFMGNQATGVAGSAAAAPSATFILGALTPNTSLTGVAAGSQIVINGVAYTILSTTGTPITAVTLNTPPGLLTAAVWNILDTQIGNPILIPAGGGLAWCPVMAMANPLGTNPGMVNGANVYNGSQNAIANLQIAASLPA